jgi:hypothetical protein
VASSQVGPNQLCPCGSGKKHKKCCLFKERHAHYTREDRASAWTKLERYIEEKLGPEDDGALEFFWGRWWEDDRELPPALSAMGEHVFDLWFAFDEPLDNGELVVDRFLAERGSRLLDGERRYLNVLRDSSMRLYEIEDLRPGESVALRDVIEGDRIAVLERSGSKTLDRFEWVAARVVSAGASGTPEIEGILQVPDPFHESIREQLRKKREDFLEKNPGAPLTRFYKRLPPAFHELWVPAGHRRPERDPQPRCSSGLRHRATRVGSRLLASGDRARAARGAVRSPP